MVRCQGLVEAALAILGPAQGRLGAEGAPGTTVHIGARHVKAVSTLATFPRKHFALQRDRHSAGFNSWVGGHERKDARAAGHAELQAAIV